MFKLEVGAKPERIFWHTFILIAWEYENSFWNGYEFYIAYLIWINIEILLTRQRWGSRERERERERERDDFSTRYKIHIVKFLPL